VDCLVPHRQTDTHLHTRVQSKGRYEFLTSDSAHISVSGGEGVGGNYSRTVVSNPVIHWLFLQEDRNVHSFLLWLNIVMFLAADVYWLCQLILLF
jgi:hypothetical protein